MAPVIGRATGSSYIPGCSLLAVLALEIREGWARSSFRYAVRWAFFLGVVVWSPVVVIAFFAGPERPHDALAVVVVNLALMALGVAGCLDRRVPARLVFVGQLAAFVANWAMTADPSTPFAVATYQIFVFAAVGQGLVLRRRRDLVLSVLCCLAAAAALCLVRPSYGLQVPISTALTGSLAIVVGRPGLAPLLRFARAVDENHDEAVRASVRLDARRTAVRSAAEQQRRVHDTAINTLAAVVRGGRAVADVEAVRARCRADVGVLEQLLDDSQHEVAGSASLEDAWARHAITVDLPGLSGPDLAATWARLPLGIRAALSGAVGELVTNAEKHAGVTSMSVDVRSTGGDGISVVVTDHGRGFAAGSTPERGIASSVRARLAEEGIDLDLRAAVDQGVRAEIRWQPTAERGVGGGGDLAQDVDRIRMIGALLIASLTAAGSVVLSAANHPGRFTPDYLLAALAVATTLLVWRSWRRHERLTATTSAVVVVTAPIAFLISGASVDFGRGYNLAWQAVAPALLLFILVAGARAGRLVAVIAGVAVYSVVAVLAAVAIADTGDATTTTLVVLATGLAWVAGWGIFNKQLRGMAARAVREHEVAVLADEAAEAQAAAALIRARWRVAALENTAALLRELADSLDPGSPEAVRRSRREEAYLRELTQLPLELVHAGTWFFQALSAARAREVNLKVRTGTTDLPPGDVEQVGRFLLDATTTVAPGTDLVATLFDTGDGPTLRLVADDAALATLARERPWRSGIETEVQQFGHQLLVQVAPR